MKGFKLLGYETANGITKGFVKHAAVVYRFQVRADDTITLCRIRDGKISDTPARAPKTEGMLRKALKGSIF